MITRSIYYVRGEIRNYEDEVIHEYILKVKGNTSLLKAVNEKAKRSQICYVDFKFCQIRNYRC
jgi:hypothetical protein